MDFEWDPAKAAQNHAKHGVTFELATRAFFDPCRVTTIDDRRDYGEERWATMGLVGPAVLYVVYTVREGDTIRLISARRANERERKRYRALQP